MKVDPSSRLGSALLGVAGHLARWLLLGLGATWRIEVEGEEHLEAVRRDGRRAGRPVLLSFWHGQTFMAAHFVYRALHRRGVPITVLASQSRDGELVSRMVEAWGVEPVRGSSTRGGRQALRALHRAIVRGGASPIMVPDGPVGPPHRVKVGVLVLAQLSGAPILPLAFVAERAWRLPSWDRLRIPKPFSRVAVVVAPPQEIATSLRSDALEAERARIEALLDALGARARRALDG